MSPEIVALLVLLGGIIAAVVFTIVIVVMVDPSDTSTRGETGQGRKVEKSEGV